MSLISEIKKLNNEYEIESIKLSNKYDKKFNKACKGKKVIYSDMSGNIKEGIIISATRLYFRADSDDGWPIITPAVIDIIDINHTKKRK
jgi:hypothetical protein